MEVSSILVNRQKGKPEWTLSDFSFDGVKKGVGVEDEYRKVKVEGETRIPAKTYLMGLHPGSRMSGEYYRDDKGNLILAKDRKTAEQIALYKTPHEMLWVMNVDGFEWILWHWGNTDLDTHGCYIVGSVFGSTNGRDGVINSRKKYTEIYPIIWRSITEGAKIGKQVTVTYKDNE